MSEIKELLESVEELLCCPDGDRAALKKVRQALSLLSSPQPPESENEKEMKAKWHALEPHEDSTLDYALSDVYRLAKRLDRAEADLAAIKLELSTPETAGMDKEPLYKWAATIVCAKLQLEAEKKELEEKHNELKFAVGVVVRNIKAGAVTIGWVEDYFKRILGDEFEKLGD